MATANPARAYPVQPRIGYSGGGRLGAVIDTLGWGFPQTKTVFGSAQPHLYYNIIIIILYAAAAAAAVVAVAVYTFGSAAATTSAHAATTVRGRRSSPCVTI